MRALARSLVAQPEDGQIKLYTTWRTLQLRRDCPEPFESGQYVALDAAGPLREHVCAFAREHGEDRIVVAVPRLVTGLLRTGSPADGAGRGGAAGPFPAGAWSDDQLLLPDPPGTRFRNLFTGETLETTEPMSTAGRAKSALPLGRLFADFPVSLLHRETP